MRFEIAVECKPRLLHYTWDDAQDALDDFERMIVTAWKTSIKRDFERDGITSYSATSSIVGSTDFTSYLTITLENPPSENPYEFLAVVEHAIKSAESDYSNFLEDMGVESTKVYHVPENGRKVVAGEASGHVHQYTHDRILATDSQLMEVVKCRVCGALGQRHIPFVS